MPILIRAPSGITSTSCHSNSGSVVPMSLPYAPVSSLVSHSSTTPSANEQKGNKQNTLYVISMLCSHWYGPDNERQYDSENTINMAMRMLIVKGRPTTTIGQTFRHLPRAISQAHLNLSQRHHDCAPFICKSVTLSHI